MRMAQERFVCRTFNEAHVQQWTFFSCYDDDGDGEYYMSLRERSLIWTEVYQQFTDWILFCHHILSGKF